MKRNTILLAVIAVCLGVLVYLSLTSSPQHQPPPLPSLPPGHPPIPGESIAAPDFTLESLSHGKIRLSQFRGKVVVINFWSTTCPPCLMEMPSFERLREAMKGKPFEVFAITPDPRSAVEQMVEQLKVDFPILLDPQGKVSALYGAYFSPTTVIVAPDGTVANRVVGAANWGDASVVDYINKLLKTAKAKS